MKKTSKMQGEIEIDESYFNAKKVRGVGNKRLYLDYCRHLDKHLVGVYGS